MNPFEFNIELNAKMSIAFEKTVGDLYEKLGEIVEEQVYKPSRNKGTGENGVYERTHQFADSWKLKDVSLGGERGSHYQVYQDLNTMIYDALSFQHGNDYKPLSNDGGTNSLADILNNGSDNGSNPYNFPKTTPTYCWDDFVKYVYNNVHIMFQKNCALQGIPLISTNSPIKVTGYDNNGTITKG